jgi:hypothetical protein
MSIMSEDVKTHFRGIGEWRAQARRLEDAATEDREEESPPGEE